MTEGIANLEATIARLQEATEEARAVTREAHAAIKELRHLKREMRHAADRIRDAMRDEWQDELRAAVDDGLSRLRDATVQTSADAHAKVERGFEEHVNLLMYGNRQGRGLSIFERIEQKLVQAENALATANSELPRLPPKPGPPLFAKDRA